MDAIPTPVFLVLFLALLALAAGIGVWLYNYATGGGAGSSKGERSPTAKASAEMETSIPASAQELLSVHRLERGELAIFVRGQRYYHLRGIKDAQMGIDAVEAVVHVMSFAEGWIPTIQSAQQSKPTPKSIVDQEAFLEQLRQSDLFPDPQSTGQRRRLSRSPAPLVTPADQINDLVQQRVQEQPDMAKRDIRITTSADGSLRFRVGLDTFTEVDDISDLEVKTLIQDAIREWKED